MNFNKKSIIPSQKKKNWYLVTMLNGIKEIIINPNKKFYQFPFAAEELRGSKKFNNFLMFTRSNFGERQICELLICIGKFEYFEKKFPGNKSVFSKNVFSKIKTNVPNGLLLIHFEKRKKFTFPVEISPIRLRKNYKKLFPDE